MMSTFIANASGGIQMSHGQYLTDYARSFDGSSKCQSAISFCVRLEIRFEHDSNNIMHRNELFEFGTASSHRGKVYSRQ